MRINSNFKVIATIENLRSNYICKKNTWSFITLKLVT